MRPATVHLRRSIRKSKPSCIAAVVRACAAFACGLLCVQSSRAAESPASLKPPAKDHWAFKALVRPEAPPVKNQKWVGNAIDRFILARLDEEKLEPSPEADRVTLIRRLSLDLTGLPPTLAEVDAFLADRRPDAYERVVERLLGSVHYGEHWGRHWLDAARYADTNGYEKDLPRNIWPYRDWVIHALNSDMPFNEFAIEQMAGDLLPNATVQQRVATGFHRNSMLNEEGGIDPEEFRVAAVINRVETTGKAFLGLTINCAQCHDHKYDPISQKEYYEFFAFLNSDDEPLLEVPSAEQLAGRKLILDQVAKIEDSLLAKDTNIASRQAAWEEELRDETVSWHVLEPVNYYGAVGTKFSRLDDQSLLATGSNPDVSTYTITASPHLKDVTGFRIEALTDPNLPHGGPGRTGHGNFVLTELRVEVITPDGHTNQVPLQNATADFEQPGFPASDAINGKGDAKHGWAIDAGPGRINQDRKAVFETKQNVPLPEGATLLFTLKQAYGSEHTLGRFRLSATSQAEHPIRADPLPARLRQIIDVAADQRTPEQRRELFSHYRTVDPKCADANRKIAELMNGWPQADTTLVLAARTEPRETRIFKRGDFRNPLDPVSPDVPSFLPPLPVNAPRNRLTLARWIVDEKNPLTARVIMNRVWQSYFGRGIVTTSEDFGTQGEKPSHQELLDWLACEFMARGWSMKAMHRLIVESATYRQASRVTPELYSRDQFNRLLARGPRFRVEAETVRDIALSASGLLSLKVGGPSVYPPIPDGVLNLGYGSPMKWETSMGEDRYRRGLYTFWKRTVPYPGLSIFDAPNADTTCVRRVMSNTPLQALTTLNDTVFQEAAKALALRVWKEGGKSDRERAIYAFRLCTSRDPDAREIDGILQLVKEKQQYFENRTAAAVLVASPDPKEPPTDVNLHAVAAWTLASRVLLNLDETITKE